MALPPSGVAGRHVPTASAVGFEEPLGQSDQGGHVLNSLDRCPWIEPAQEADLAAVDVANAGEVPLVEERFAHGALGAGSEAAHGLIGVPVVPEEIGTQMPDDARFVLRLQEVDHGEPKPHCHALGRAEHDPRLVAWSPPALAGLIHVPLSIHSKVGVEREVSGDSKEKVFAS